MHIPTLPGAYGPTSGWSCGGFRRTWAVAVPLVLASRVSGQAEIAGREFIAPPQKSVDHETVMLPNSIGPEP